MTEPGRVQLDRLLQMVVFLFRLRQSARLEIDDGDLEAVRVDQDVGRGEIAEDDAPLVSGLYRAHQAAEDGEEDTEELLRVRSRLRERVVLEQHRADVGAVDELLCDEVVLPVAELGDRGGERLDIAEDVEKLPLSREDVGRIVILARVEVGVWTRLFDHDELIVVRGVLSLVDTAAVGKLESLGHPETAPK